MPDLERERFEVEKMNWMIPESEKPTRLKSLKVKLRHGPHMYRCRLQKKDHGIWNVTLLGERDRGITPGQYAVFYGGRYCLGGAVIREKYSKVHCI